MSEEVGRHKGAVETLLHEQKELSRILQIVQGQLEKHLSALEDAGVDTDQFVQELQQQHGQQQQGQKQKTQGSRGQRSQQQNSRQQGKKQGSQKKRADAQRGRQASYPNEEVQDRDKAAKRQKKQRDQGTGPQNRGKPDNTKAPSGQGTANEEGDERDVEDFFEDDDEDTGTRDFNPNR